MKKVLGIFALSIIAIGTTEGMDPEQKSNVKNMVNFYNNRGATQKEDTHTQNHPRGKSEKIIELGKAVTKGTEFELNRGAVGTLDPSLVDKYNKQNATGINTTQNNPSARQTRNGDAPTGTPLTGDGNNSGQTEIQNNGDDSATPPSNTSGVGGAVDSSQNPQSDVGSSSEQNGTPYSGPRDDKAVWDKYAALCKAEEQQEEEVEKRRKKLRAYKIFEAYKAKLKAQEKEGGKMSVTAIEVLNKRIAAIENKYPDLKKIGNDPTAFGQAITEVNSSLAEAEGLLQEAGRNRENYWVQNGDDYMLGLAIRFNRQ